MLHRQGHPGRRAESLLGLYDALFGRPGWGNSLPDEPKLFPGKNQSPAGGVIAFSFLIHTTTSLIS
jgi:hypothetical protein